LQSINGERLFVPTIAEIGFMFSFRFVRHQVIAMSVPSRRTTLQDILR
jgi:hypothetical protein